MNSSYLGISASDLTRRGGIHTAREIAGQPDLWSAVWDALQQSYGSIRLFIDDFIARRECDIILTGAGTSAFIGEILAGWLDGTTGLRFRAAATTDIVTHPHLVLNRTRPTLLVSFARSGNSPESVATMELANQLCRNVAHLVITCNPEGQLVKRISSNNGVSFLLPPEADDKSLAMTGSFTAMTFAGLILLGGMPLESMQSAVKNFVEYGKYFFTHFLPGLRNLADSSFHRAVFLGSGPMQGSACESHLKLQELTDGHVICKFDSFLGFRHGPKAVINRDTLNVFLFSSDQYVSLYEADLVSDINRSEKGLFRLGISEQKLKRADLDLNIYFTEKATRISEPLLAIVSVLPAQVLGFFKSLALGLMPDTPSVSGTITRVVQGVHIYDYKL